MTLAGYLLDTQKSIQHMADQTNLAELIYQLEWPIKNTQSFLSQDKLFINWGAKGFVCTDLAPIKYN